MRRRCGAWPRRKATDVDRRRYFEIARGSALGCGAIQDVLEVCAALCPARRNAEAERSARPYRGHADELGRRGHTVREEAVEYGTLGIDPDADSDSDPEILRLLTDATRDGERRNKPLQPTRAAQANALTEAAEERPGRLSARVGSKCGVAYPAAMNVSVLGGRESDGRWIADVAELLGVQPAGIAEPFGKPDAAGAAQALSDGGSRFSGAMSDSSTAQVL